MLPTLEKLPQLKLLGQKIDEETLTKVKELHYLIFQAYSGTEALTAQVRISSLFCLGFEYHFSSSLADAYEAQGNSRGTD